MTDLTRQHAWSLPSMLADAFNIAIGEFCHEVAGAALRWLDHAEQRPAFQRNFRPVPPAVSGRVAPYIVGLPVVT